MSALTTVRESSPSKAWARALERTAHIARNPGRLLPDVIEEYARDHGSSPALLSDAQQLTYGQLVERSNMYMRWALSLALGRGETVCLLMPNRPEYLAIWLGVIRTGAVVSLLNANLTGRSLSHCINIVEPKHIIVDAALIDAWTTAEPFLERKPQLWVDNRDFAGYSAEGTGALGGACPGVSIKDTALYIYTSGTTGLPKAARVSHFRLMQWAHWFAGMMDAVPQDRMYNCLPLYHSVGGVVAAGPMLVVGGSVVIRDGFSARSFWQEVRKWDCTLFQYIGELCRYLLSAEADELEAGHTIRMACGNGLRPEVWSRFKERFRIPQIFEFYAATEGNVSLFNIEGKPGAIGRIPPFLAHRFATVLVRLDIETLQPVRDEKGFCIRCERGETGEAIGRISGDGANLNSQFEGYTNTDQSDRKVLRDVFESGDVWFRTGDLMRKDEKGYFYFVDRIGDTFRWKGENVSTQEVSEAICEFPGVSEASVYGVTVPGGDGRAGMAALVADNDLDLTALRAHLTSRLPRYAVPLFLRMRGELQRTATFKHVKNDLVTQSYDPGVTSDPLYFNDPERATFIRLDEDLFKRIQTGQSGVSRANCVKPETIAIHGGYTDDPTTKAVAVPIYQTVAYAFDSADHGAALFNLEVEGYRYTRIGNPTTAVLERRVAALEGGCEALCAATGQAALTYAALNVTELGSNIVSVPQLYGTTYTLFAHVLPSQGVQVRFAESDQASDVAKLIDGKTKAVYCETVGNPAGNICDIEALAAVAHEHGVPLIVDNTVPTPILLRPIEYGADIVTHSLTKFMGGHGTTLGGIVVDSGRFPWRKHAQRFPMFNQPDHSYHGLVYVDHFGDAAYIGRCRSVYQRNMGAVLSPLSSFLLLQGIETVALRIERHVENGRKVAEFLRRHPKVEWVNYAGFEDSPYYALARKYLGGRACSLLTFGIQGGFEAGKRFYDALELVKRLVNLGDAKSLACHPASTTHRQMSAEEQRKAGVGPEMIRLSVGIEHIDDILTDLDRALAASKGL